MCAAAAVWFSTSAAAADSFQNLRGGEGSETAHVVKVTLDDGFARYTVRRSVRNDEDYTEQLGLSINLPPGAAADGLRVRAGGVWHAGKLMKADAARALYAELTDTESERPLRTKVASRAPVLLEWESTGAITVSAYPVAPGETITFEYTMIAPTCWGNGRQYLQYPMRGAGAFVEPLIAVTTGEHGGNVTLHGATAPAIEGMVCNDGITVTAGAHTTIEIAPPDIETAAIRYGSYDTVAGNTVVRVDVDTAAQLAPLPTRARVVFVVDGSWSTGDERLTDQLALARGYLSHVPDAEFEVVVFRRYAERLFGGFESAEAFDRIVPRLSSDQRALGNGSNIEQGVALAANLLADTSGPARVVVFTDERTRTAYSNDLGIAAASPLPRHAVLHVIDRDRSSGYGAMNETRDDDALLAPLAGAFGGMLLRVGGDTSDAAGVAATMLGVVRPIRIDGFTVDADGISDISSPASILAEGEGRRRMALVPRKPKTVRVSGKIWGRTWTRTLESHTALSDAIPGLVFGDYVHGQMVEAEQVAAAMTSGAVSSYTSYLAAEDRPVPIPDEDESLLGLRGGSYSSICGGHSRCGISSRCGGGYGTAGRYVEPPRHDDLLRGFMKSTLDQCGRAAGVDEIAVWMAVEGTGTEIVDVTIEGDASDDLRECLVDGAWDIRLSAEFNKHHGTYDAALLWQR